MRMKRLLLLFATFVACLGLQAQFSYTNIDNFESGSTSATVLWSGAAAVVNNSTGTTGSKVLQVTDNAGYPFVNIPVSFESGKTWTDYDGIEVSIYPKSGTIAGSGSKAVGLDLSLLKAYENAGVTYKDASGSTISDVISWVGQNKGVNYVRIRLFVDPTSNYAKALAGGSSYMNQLGGDLATVKVLGKRVKDAGLKFLLDIQYSDGWADPGKQLMPESWTSTCTSQTALQNKVYSYTKDVLNQLVAYGATPDMVQVGNEITYGMFYTSYDTPAGNYTNGGITASYSSTNAGRAGIHCFATYWADNTPSQDSYWVNLCNVIKKGCQAVREVCPSAKIMLHTERSTYTDWKATASGYTNMYLAEMFYQKMQEKSVDYDVIGLSYYPEDHGTMDKLNTILSALESRFPTKDIMLAEYGYSNNYYRGNNKPGTIGYYRRNDTNNSCPLAQKEFISALISMLNSHSRVKGMFYWFAEENESTDSGPYGNGNAWRNTGLWANSSTNYASNLTSTAYSAPAGRALPALDVLADFQDAGAVVTKSAYYAQTWLKFYDEAGTASYLHKKVGLNVDDEWGVDFTTNGLGSWYTVKFGFRADSIASYISAVGSTPSSINLELRNYTNPSETNNDFYLDNIRFYKNTNESYALDFEDGTINSPSSAISDAWCTGSQVVKANPSKSGINTSDKVMTVTNTYVDGCALYTWSVALPSDLSLYDSIYIDVYPTSGTSYLTLQFDDGSWTKLYDGTTITSWTANAWNRLKIALSDLSDLTATHMYFGMWESGYSIDNITFHAKPATTYTVTWNATTNGGTCATASTVVNEGDPIGTLPTATKTGYTFKGWYTQATGGTQITASTVPTASVTYYAQFTPNTNTAYTVRHLWQNINDDEYTLHESESKTGTTGAQTAATAKSYTGFTAKSFSQGTIAANGSTVVDIYYDRKTYTITWKDGDNQTIETDNNVRYGATPSYDGATPTKTATAQYTFAFNGTWSPAISTVTANQTYTAQFSQTVNQYTLTVNGGSGSGTYDYGTLVTITATPADNYHFTQWADNVMTASRQVTVTANATYTALSEEDAKTTVYLVPSVWTADNAKYAAYVFEDGKAAAWSALMTQTADGKAYTTQVYAYAKIIFVRLKNTATSGNWDDKWNQTADLALNTATYNCYQITGWGSSDGFWRNYPFYYVEFQDFDGTVLKRDTVDSGNAATAPTAPTRTGYTFSGWDNLFSNVTTDLTVTAQYTPNTNTAYTVRHMWQNIDDNGYTLHESEAKTGTTGAQTAATAKSYTGFTAKAFSQKEIAAEGNTVVDIYYDRKTYTITWKDGDNNTIETDLNVKYGATPSYNGSTPTKTATAQYTYTFNGTWSPAIAEVTGNQTYVAQFDQTVNEYKITWKNEDGSVIDYTTVAYGVVPTHADATKAADAEYTYTFAGWTPNVVAVTGAAEYTAVFSKTKNSYTITWNDENGNLIDQTTVEYGVVPTHADPTKEATAQYTYTFAGWTPEVVAVTANATYQATFTSTVNSYTITWKNDDGSVIDHTIVAYGETPTHADVTKTATAEFTYTFAGWTPTIVPVTGDAEYTAVFTAKTNTYTVSFNANGHGTAPEAQTVAYGAKATQPTISAVEGYSFDGWYREAGCATAWNYDTDVVTGDIELFAKWTIHSWTLTWDLNGGNIVGTGYTPSGLTEYGTPLVAPTVELQGYTLAGWNPAVDATMPDKDITYKATWAAAGDTHYTVKHWQQNLVGNDYTEVTADEQDQTGATGSQTAAIAKSYTGFTAQAFSQETIAADGSTVVNIYYDRNTYTITWVDGDNQIIETDQNVRYGATPSYDGATPTKTAADQYSYTFSSWTPAVVAVSEDAVYTAQFEATLNKYTIRFLNWNGVELYTMQVEYGTTPVYEPLPPTKPQTDQYKYTFAGWDPELAPVTGDATYTAVFTESLQVYEVCFFNDDEILECGEWEYGSTPVYRGPEPTKAPDDTFFYTFCGWGEIHPVNGDNSYSAQFCGTWRYYDGVVINSSDPTMGTVAANPQKDTYEYGEEVTVTATANEGYHFTEWQDEEGNTVSTETTTTVTVTANTTITAVFEPNTNTRYLVHHLQQNLNDDLYTLVETDTLYGTTGRLTQVETVRRNYPGFDIKYCEDVPIAADGSTELNALYDRLTYSVRWIVEDAERLDTLRYGAMPDYGSVPTKQGNAQYTYTFAGWDPEVVTVTADATYRAVFSSEVNRYTVTFHANGHATDPEQASVEYGRTVNCTTLYADDGWIFDGWFREAGCQTPWDCLQDVVTADIDLYAKWIPSENMFYTVNYWQQNIYDDDYTLVEFEQIKGTTGQMTQAEAKTYTGFTMLPFSQVPIAPNTEVNIYYDRLRYEVNFVVEGVAVQTDSVRYYGSAEYRGETPTKPETDTHYYTFWCWDKATNMPIVADVTFTALFNEYSKGGGTGLEQVVITESGISGPKGMRIYDYTGKDVTNAMDHLYQGTYIIVLDGKTKKVMIP